MTASSSSSQSDVGTQKNSWFSRTLHTEIIINAPADVVWDVFLEFEQYARWNPFMSVTGVPEVGRQLNLFIRTDKNSVIKFKPRVLECEPNKRLRWLGRWGLPGLFDGEHSFEIRPLRQNEVLFIQREYFKGLLVPLLWYAVRAKTQAGFNAMNQALKEQVEFK